MKRSRINQIMQAADEMIRHHGFTLPPFAYGAASHAVAGPDGTGTLHIDANAILPLAEQLFTALLRAGFPPGRPDIIQACATRPGFFIGEKKAGAHLLALQHIGDQGCHLHVASIKCEVNRFVTAGDRNLGGRHHRGAAARQDSQEPFTGVAHG